MPTRQLFSVVLLRTGRAGAALHAGMHLGKQCGQILVPALRVHFIQGLSPTLEPCMVSLNPFVTHVWTCWPRADSDVLTVASHVACTPAVRRSCQIVERPFSGGTGVEWLVQKQILWRSACDVHVPGGHCCQCMVPLNPFIRNP